MPLICHGEKKELLEPSGSLEPLPPVAANRSPLVRPAPIAASSNCSPSCGSPAHPGLLCAVLPASLPPYDASPVRRATAGARSAAPHGRMLGAGGTPRASTRGGRTAAASRRSLRITMVQMVFVLASGLNIAGEVSPNTLAPVSSTLPASPPFTHADCSYSPDSWLKLLAGCAARQFVACRSTPMSRL